MLLADVDGKVRLSLRRKPFVNVDKPRDDHRFDAMCQAPFTNAYLGAFAHLTEDEWPHSLLHAFGRTGRQPVVHVSMQGHTFARRSFDEFEVMTGNAPHFAFQVNEDTMKASIARKKATVPADDFLAPDRPPAKKARVDGVGASDGVKGDLETWLSELLDDSEMAELVDVLHMAKALDHDESECDVGPEECEGEESDG